MSIRVQYTFSCDFAGCKKQSGIGYEPQTIDRTEALSMTPAGWVLIANGSSAYFKAYCLEHSKP